MTEYRIVNGKKYHEDISLNKEQFKHKDNIKNALKEHGKRVVDKLEKVLTSGKRTGRKYRGLPNVSSAPGEPPISQSGRLVKGLGYKASSYRDLIVYNNAKNNGAPYPLFLEIGTGRMRPRKWWVNNIESLHYELQKDLAKL